MSEEKIIIKINEEGDIEVETFGIMGPICDEEIEKILKNIALTYEDTKKDEYFMEPEVNLTRKQKQTRGIS